ncbi:tandem-95 repeat protein [Microbacterium sp. CFH 90308]|uniref:Tandem-95 repeat protein n=1 Tax=Microbacterium salsuginis TaxID=2722803 RepID=A0ABX1KFJ7_9MICO|nr:Ig-like domain-containing protein [Microbacterium sp. CFH 90308]NLP85053.1 tandem-95 repeat protein [Microbacterium sp. CFH 90308]
MRLFAGLRARPRALASAGAVTAAAVVVTTLAFIYEGLPTTEVDLHDGGVWVTKESALLVGHFNHESQVLDAGLRTVSDDYDILQSGSTVLVMDEADSTLAVVDPANVALGEPVDLPGAAKAVLGGQTLAVLDTASGDLWVAPAQSAGSLKVQGNDPLVNLGKGADAAVGVDGTVYAVAPASGEVVIVRTDAEGEPAEPERRTVEGLPEAAAASITVVGDQPVVLDADTGTVYLNGSQVPVKGATVLQQPSTAADVVAVATSSQLVNVPLDGSKPQEVDAGGEGSPAPPVFLDGCTYAAWSGSGRFLRDCAGDADDLETDVAGIEPTSVLRFRVNRDVIVLNDVIGGATWMAAEDLRRVDNWEEITPPEGESEEDERTSEDTTETTLPERSDVNTPPTAADDDFGVRPGRTTMLAVLDNDSDPDGDILTARVTGDGPSFGEIQAVENGRALQIAVPEDATGSTSFTYEITDGRGGSDTATVDLTVHGWDVNEAPKAKRVTTVAVEAGGVVTYNLLPDWYDPDGDDVFLKSAVAADGDESDFTSDGRVTFRAVGGTQGRKDVPVVVSDGTDDATGDVRFDVKPIGTTVPVTNADYVVVRAGQTATVSPLLNDVSSTREPLRLARVDEVDGATIAPDYPNKTFSFRADTAGTYYVQYLVAAGVQPVPGLVRVDVIEQGETDLPPVAVRDVALLPSGGEVLVDVLQNDSDPNGGILVVQSVTVEPGAGIAVAVLNHETLRITDQAALAQQVRVSYRISNGSQQAEADVIVIPVPAPAQLRPPVANDDTAVVRAGDVVTIPVLDNDYHPNNDAMHVAPQLVEPLPEPESGEIFVSQDTVRFRASDEPGTVYATYEVVDSTGQKDAGYITIQVVPVNAETNAVPRPRDITSRVLSGSRVRIGVPLDGIDGDGDSVELVGVDTPPGKGRIVETGSDYLVYEAFGDTAGVDGFTYRVRDRLGAEATATIRVGIAPPESANQSPYAVKDSVVMRPGRSVAVPVMANDSDPDGDRIDLISNALVLSDEDGLEAEVKGGRVVVTSPDQPVETSLQYSIKDERGARATAVLQITVAEDVPLLPPIARDDYVRAADVEDGLADVDVLGNDEDPDGTIDALTVTIADAATRVRADGTVQVTLRDDSQLIQYTLTDEDGNEASAFIHVPGLLKLPPTLTTTAPIEVRSGETIEIPLSEHVRAVDGGRVIVTEAAKVTAAHSNGASLIKDEATLVYTSASDYFGDDAITFEVTDGTGPDDPAGRTATLTLPITVLPPENQQPTFANGQMDVAPGEEASSLDLAALTDDPDPDDLAGMQYEIVGGSPDGMTASIEGGELRVSAAADTPKGSAATIALRITDGVTDPVDGSVNVRVTASTRPLPTANDDVIDEAHQGKTQNVAVLANDFNPFEGDGKPLKITTASVDTGDGTAKVTGESIEVTPDESFFGTMVVRYRVQDATADVDREVEGRIRLTVQGRPDAPGTPTVSSVQDRTVVMSWTPPADNGAEITGYTVSSTSGAYSKKCPATTCTLDGLTNNVEYNFTVIATNRVGDSDPSAPSATARPDARPDTPQAPTLGFGDRSLKVAWVTPPTPGSPVESFNLQISPAPPSGVSLKAQVTGNSLVWEGLENGVSYQVQVQAVNRAPEPSSWSAWSLGEIPAKAPDAPAAPTMNRLDPVGSQSQLEVVWTPPASNGDAISAYQVQVLHGGAVTNTIDVSGSATRQVVNVPNSTTSYAFKVRAQNKAGWGAWSAASEPMRAVGVPGSPTNVTLSTPDPDSSVLVTYTNAPGNGTDQSEMSYEYSLNNGPWMALLNGNKISGLSTSTDYTVRMRASVRYGTIDFDDGYSYSSEPSAVSNSVRPYGPVNTPGASASANGTTITYSWSAPADNGRTIQVMQVNINGEGWKNVGRTGSESRSLGYSTTSSIQVKAMDTEGQWSAVATASATTMARPQPTATTAKGASGYWPGQCEHSSCARISVDVTNFAAGNYQVRCNDNEPSDGPGTWRNAYIPADGRFDLTCFFGNPGYQVWVDIQGGTPGSSAPIVW